MTPEAIRILNSIGWRVAERVSPDFARSLINRLTETGGRLGVRRTDSQVIAKQMNGLMKSAFELHKRLSELPDGLAHQINLAGQAITGFEALQAGRDNCKVQHGANIETATRALWALLPGIEAVLSRAEEEAGQMDTAGKASLPRGAPKNAAAYEVAQTMARIFVLGTGRIPTIGRREDGKGVSGDYGRAVEGIFKELNLGVSDAYGPCKNALDGLGENELKLLLLIRCPVTRTQVLLRMEKCSPVV